MPRNSISRRVARAAAIGGSRSYREKRPVGWYAILVVVCVVGLALIVFSRQELMNANAAASTTTSTTTTTQPGAPTTDDHWQVALSVDICGTEANFPTSSNLLSGIITSGNGVVDIEPARAGADAAQFEGSNATLGKFLTSEKATLTTTSLTLPKSMGKLAGTYANGGKCDTKSGTVELYLWSSPTTATPLSTFVTPGITYSNGEMYLLGFLPKGASVPRPLGAKAVESFITPTTTTTTPKSATTTTTPKSTTTTTTTTAGTTTTTTKS